MSGTNALMMRILSRSRNQSTDYIKVNQKIKLKAVPISIAGIARLRAKGLSEGPPARMTAWTDLLISSVAILEIFLRVCERLSLGLGGFFSRSCCSSIWLVVASTACMMLQDKSKTPKSEIKYNIDLLITKLSISLPEFYFRICTQIVSYEVFKSSSGQTLVQTLPHRLEVQS